MQLVACTRDNVSPSFVLEFLKRISVIIKVRRVVVGKEWSHSIRRGCRLRARVMPARH